LRMKVIIGRGRVSGGPLERQQPQRAAFAENDIIAKVTEQAEADDGCEIAADQITLFDQSLHVLMETQANPLCKTKNVTESMSYTGTLQEQMKVSDSGDSLFRIVGFRHFFLFRDPV